MERVRQLRPALLLSPRRPAHRQYPRREFRRQWELAATQEPAGRAGSYGGRSSAPAGPLRPLFGHDSSRLQVRTFTMPPEKEGAWCQADVQLVPQAVRWRNLDRRCSN